MSNDLAQRFLVETKKDFHNLDRKAIFNKQTALIKIINETLSPAAFANFISNYKNIASIGTFFDSRLKAKSRLIIETRLIQFLTKEKLIKEQKDLLTNYIASFSDNGLGLKSFLNEEIFRLKKEIGLLTETQKNAKNNTISSKLERVLVKLNKFSYMPITEQLIRDVFYIQDLVEEVKK